MRLVSGRPVRRSFFKLLTRLFFGRAYAHAQDWLPGLVLDIPSEKGESGSICYRGLVVANLLHPAVLQAESKSSIYIVGSGPSIKDNHLALAEPGTCLLLNGAISLIGGAVSLPLAVAVEDERFVWRHFDLMREKIALGTICLFSTSVIRALCEIDKTWLHGRSIILINDVRKPYRLSRRSNADIADFKFACLSCDGSAGISIEPALGVFQGGSVVITALQFAICCKPEEIGFFGIDISNAAEPRFYEKAGNVAMSGLVEGQKRILDHIVLAKTVCREENIRLSNFSKISALRQCGLVYDDRFARRD